MGQITKRDGWFQGENQTFEWQVFGSDHRTVEPIDDWTVEFRMARGKGGVSVLRIPASIDDPENGILRVSVQAADTIPLVPQTYFYELWRTDIGHESSIDDGPAHLQARIA